MVHSFMQVSVFGLRVWGCAGVLSRTFPLHQLSLCSVVFMFCLFFEMREELKIRFLLILFFFFFFFYYL